MSYVTLSEDRFPAASGLGCGPACACGMSRSGCSCRRCRAIVFRLGERYVEEEEEGESPAPARRSTPRARRPATPVRKLGGWGELGQGSVLHGPISLGEPIGKKTGPEGIPPPSSPSEKDVEEFAKKQQAEFLKACSGLRMLEWLDRLSPAERVCQWERNIRELPNVYKLKAELEKAVRERKLPPDAIGKIMAQLLKALGYPNGYALGPIADEMARARCKLAQAQWTFCASTCYGPAGRRLAFRQP